MNKLMIGIERKSDFSEESIFEYFVKRDLDKDDDYIYHADNKFEYFVVEKANYIVFKEYNNLNFFTTHVIDYLRTLPNEDTVFIQEDDGSGRVEMDAVLFSGSVESFIKFWDNLGEEGI
jgi:hypothetical protein